MTPPNTLLRMLGAGRLPGADRLADLTAALQKRLPSLLPVPAAPTAPDNRFRAGRFHLGAESRPYRLYVPGRPIEARPALIVMLHGCTQSPEDFAAGTRMNTLAEAHGFLVLYPGQIQSANAQGCWNWFRPADQVRDTGEPGLIAGMTRQVIAAHDIDPRRVFVAGLSAGGAMAATLGALYPDLYAAIGTHSGLAHGAAADMGSAFTAMRQGRPGAGRITIPTIIFQGDRDTTVNPKNGNAIATQAMPADHSVRDVSEGISGHGWTRTRHVGAGGRSLLEHWVIHGAGHAWSGGDPVGSYTDASGPDASSEMLRFFLAR